MFSIAIVSVLLSVGPQASSQTVPRVSREFRDNDYLQVIVEGRRQRGAAAQRALVVNQRKALAVELDYLISSGSCVEANGVAQRSGYADIAQRVQEACEVRAQSSAPPTSN